MTCPSDAPHGRFCKSSTFAETGKPVAQRGRSGSSQKGEHQSFGPEWRLVAGHVGAEQHDGPPRQVTVGNGIRCTVGPVELCESVQLNCTAADVTVEGQGLTSSAGEMHVGCRVSHSSNLVQDLPALFSAPESGRDS